MQGRQIKMHEVFSRIQNKTGNKGTNGTEQDKNKYFYNNNTIKMAVMIKVSIMYYNDIIILRN